MSNLMKEIAVLKERAKIEQILLRAERMVCVKCCKREAGAHQSRSNNILCELLTKVFIF